MLFKNVSDGIFKSDDKTQVPHNLTGTNEAVSASCRILLTDDDPVAQKMIPWLLKAYGYQVDVVSDGKEALQALELYDYALVLMDCMMPTLNGYDTTAVIRDQNSAVRNHTIPVIALTANALPENRDKCLTAGMDDYLSKPLEVAELMTMLDKWLHFGTMPDSTQPEQSHTIVDGDTGSIVLTSTIFDVDDFVRRNLDNLELARDVATIFLDTHPLYIQAIRTALAAQDKEELHNASHKLKGAAVNLALPLLSEAARTLESIADSGNLERARQKLTFLELCFEQAAIVIREWLKSSQEKA